MGLITEPPFSWPDGGTVISSAGSSTQIGRGAILLGLNSASAVYASANRAYFVPFVLEYPATAYQMGVYNGTVVSGNVDVGIYDVHGTRLVSIGTTAQAGTSAVQKFNIADTLLMPGTYYMAMAADNITATYFRNTITNLMLQAGGMKEMSTAFVLPATATFANISSAYCPTIFIQLHPTIL